MAYSPRYDGSYPTSQGYMDPFSGGARDEPFRSPDFLPHDDTKTFTTTTSGIPAIDPLAPLPGSTSDAQLLATNYRQQNVTPGPSLGRPLSVVYSEERPSSPSIFEATYRDNDPYFPKKTDETSLVQNAADMGKTVHFQDLGTHLIIRNAHVLILHIRLRRTCWKRTKYRGGEGVTMAEGFWDGVGVGEISIRAAHRE